MYRLLHLWFSAIHFNSANGLFFMILIITFCHNIEFKLIGTPTAPWVTSTKVTGSWKSLWPRGLHRMSESPRTMSRYNARRKISKGYCCRILYVRRVSFFEFQSKLELVLLYNITICAWAHSNRANKSEGEKEIKRLYVELWVEFFLFCNLQNVLKSAL